MNKIYKMNIYLKWTIIVGLNSILGFIFGNTFGDYAFLLGMILGVLSWLVAYLCFDKFLIKTGRIDQSRKLTLCAILRIPLQFTFMPDLYAGFLAGATVQFLGIPKLGNTFIDAYSTTIFTGLFLSAVCSIIYLFISGIEEFKKVRKIA